MSPSPTVPLEGLPGYRAVRDFMQWSCSPINLAVTRIVVFGLLAAVLVSEHPIWYTRLPAVLLVPPPGLARVIPVMPRGRAFVAIATGIAFVASLAAAVGWHSRASAWIAASAGLYALTIPQIWGKVNHYHDVLWFAVVLAASPLGDAWSVDALRRREPPRPNSTAYGFPLRCIALLLGLVYYFPGISKLRVGPAWVWSDNLRNLIWLKWMEFDAFQPLLPVDRWPLMLRLGAACTILFECSFLWLILSRRTRPFAVAGGLGFHALTAVFMGINFWVVYACYVALVDWGSFSKTAVGAPRSLDGSTRLVGDGLLWAVALAGIVKFNSWPVSIYPQFATLAPPIEQTLELEFVDATGRALPSAQAVTRLRSKMGEDRLTTMLHRMLVAKPLTQRRRAEALTEVMRREDPLLAKATLVRVWGLTRSTNPADHRAVLARRLEVTIRVTQDNPLSAGTDTSGGRTTGANR